MIGRVYMAARYGRREEIAGYAGQLRDLGYVVTSRWLDGAHGEDDNDLTPELSEQFAGEDVADLTEADTLIAFSEDPDSGHSRGGRHVELGMALVMGHRIVCIGPRENVFYHLRRRVQQWDTWDAYLAALREEVAP